MARLEIWEDNSIHGNPWKAIPLAPGHHLCPLPDSPFLSFLYSLPVLTGLLTLPGPVFPTPPPWIIMLLPPDLPFSLNHYIFMSHPGTKVWLKCHCSVKNINKYIHTYYKLLKTHCILGTHPSPLTLTTTVTGRCYHTHFVGKEAGSKTKRAHS